MARGMRGAHFLAIFCTFSMILFRDTHGQVSFNGLTGFSLNPPYFNLAVGSRISATATCGQDEAGGARYELYCKLVGGPTTGLDTQNIQGQFCDYCNSDDPNKAYPATNAIDGTERWWQSPPLSRGISYNEVNVTLDFGQLFHVAYILIKFANSPRPDLWVLERSVDNGRTYNPWQYFAHSKRECIERFGKQPNARVVNDDDQLCTTEYSRTVPLENGEIVVSLVNGRPGSKNFTYSPVLQDFTKATNIRLRFLRTSTLLGHLISKAQRDPTVTRRYYYSIKDISVGGRCVCHGHAQMCGGDRNQDTNRLQCECQHNTCGESCDHCCPGFNQKPWRAATADSPNECQPCQCFSHAFDCYYDPEVEQRGASLDTFGRYNGGGVCINCQHNTAGVNCEKCREGFYRPYGLPPESPTGCIPCRCDVSTTVGCESGSGRCICKPQFAGENCDRCADGHYYYPQCIRYPGYQMTTKSPAGPIVGPTACPPGYFGSPSCQQCICDYRGTVYGVCDASGRCLCREGVEGEQCDRCRPGYRSFPNCHACRCDGAGVADSDCRPNGQCVCLPNYGGQECDECAPGFYGYPDCAACQCSQEGSYGNICNPVSGQCLCLPGVVGQRCDHCASGLRFPHCSASSSQCNPAGTEITDPQTGSCRCLPNIEGTLCDRCKPLYWNLLTDNPRGCIECLCDVKGTLSGVGECEQKSGQCHCKPNACGHVCDTCKNGFFLLQKKNYFGCQGCQCDVGGAIDMACDEMLGQCRCRKNVVGRKCTEPAPSYYFPTLHQLKFEVEDGTTPNSRPARFGYNPQEFPDFSWRGYAVLSPAQPEVILTFTLDFPGPFHIVLRYATPQHKGRARVRAKVLVVDEAGFQSCCDSCAITVTGLSLSSLQSEVRVTVHVDPKDGRQHLFRVVLRFTNPSSNSVNGSIKATNNRGTAGSGQSKEVVFPKSPSPSFLTVPGEGFAEPFALTPGKWIIHIRAEGVLLDYLVLLPRDYYEAPLLQEKITQPCTYLPTANRNTNCLLYRHVAMESFSSALGSQGILSSRRGRRRRQTHVRRPTPDHPEMAALNGRQSQLQLSLRVPRPGLYALVLEYANEVDSVQNLNILISGQLDGQIPARVNIYSCAYSFLCRSVAVDSSNQVAMLELTHKTELLLQTSTTSFLLYKVYAVPAEEYSIEYVKPKVLCVSTHGRFTDDSRHCVLRQFDKPTSARILYAARDGQLSSAPAVAFQQVENEDWRRRRQSGTFPVREPQSDAILLKFPQTRINFTPEVPLPGRYVVVVHYHQPEHITFPVEVRVDAGHEWKGSINASFCPSVSGCREVVIADRRIALDFDHQPWRLPSISMIVPPTKTLLLLCHIPNNNNEGTVFYLAATHSLMKAKLPTSVRLEQDYIMLVPDSSYTPDLLKEKPLDKSSDFIQQCRREGFYIDPTTSSEFCRDSARSLVAAYNDGALPCNCDKSGSRGTTCDPVGGQCPCRQHVIGQQCTKCATGYYGFPYCRQCECGRRLCDDVTGRCICPPQTIKPACDVCQNETFSYHPLLGCEGCECSPYGIKENAGPDCDRVSGQCSCKPRIAGRQCDRCAAGFYRFPDCVPCDCNQGGVTPNMCHSDTGRCLCKRNVAGVRCDICREGSFYFDLSNPHGCTSCFCFGVTDQCQSSSMHRGKFVEMRGWRLESPDQEEVPSVLNKASNTVVADIQELPATVQDLHWVAPPSYIGDSVSSYGGFLTYQSKSFGIPSEGMNLMDRRPDVLLTGQEMTLIHMAPQVQFPDKLYQGRVQLVEGNWRHAGTNRPVSREDMMMVLAGLVDLRIRALYFTQTQRLSIGEVGMEEATITGTGGPGNTVENCSCPTEYTGDSCEKCAPGFYRDGSGPYLGRCVPCDCNGLADECEEKTGRCLNCQYNTAGDHCDRCKEGYYGNAAQRTCRVCPCPFNAPTNSFAIGCRQVYGDFECICKAGYTGDRCERCAPGFYGDPLIPGGSCRPCNCNGNDNNCDPKTGVCKNTLEPGDTSTDENCKECDNCAQTLLNDLEKLDDEMGKIKAQLENATASASSQDRLKKLEKAVSDTKILVNKFSSSINTQKSRVNQLEDDMNTVRNDISSLKDKADESSTDADKAVADIEKTHKRAKDLDSAIRNMLKKIQALLDQLKEGGASGSGDRLPNENLAKMLEDAQRMVKEMENRNFTPQKTAAEKERDEAKKLLDYIKANVSKQCDQNEAAAEKLRGLLQDYNTKLKDLDEALKQAADLVKKANAQNGLNAQALEDLQKRISDLKKERKTVEDQIAMAEDELQKTEDLVKMLIDSKTEYEHLAAQLDGAKTDLNKKVTEIVKAAKKEPIVVKAEDHANALKNLAKELEDAVKNASGLTEVRNAKDAIDAYKNITDTINAAEKAANEAKEAADNALNNVNNQKLTQRAKDLRDTGDDLLKNAQDAENDLRDTVDDLTAIKKRLKNADEKKKALEKDLLDAQKQLNDTKRDDIGNMIDEAKRKAASANDTASTTMDKLNAIRKEIDKINVTPVDSNLSSVLDDVDQSVKKLLNTIPSLNDKISEVENLTSQFTPLSNISENIKKIKELIEHARDAANRIMIPMKFTGDGHVEMRPPKDLEDLKAYTAMSLSLQRNKLRGDGRRRRRQTADTGNMFVLYLGDRNSLNYIGMALKNNVLHGVYKLNGVEYQIVTDSITMSSSEPATFDKVDLHRMYQDAEIILTKESTSNPAGREIKKNNQGQQSKNLLDLSPSDVVFYVGGYPANFTPPSSLNYPNYKGCIEFSSFNDKVVSLYNFQKAEKVNLETPCRRHVPPMDSSYFEGTGYGRININRVLQALRIEMTVYTRSENGLLFYIGNEDQYFTLTMEKGVVFLRSNLLKQPVTNNQKIFPTNDWAEIFIIIRNGKLKIRIANKDVAEIEGDLGVYNEYYLGGTSQDLRERYNITMQPFKGCMKNFKLHGDFKTIDENVGISKGCSTDSLITRKAEFSLGSSLSTKPAGFSLAEDHTVSLGFKSTKNQGLILQKKQLDAGLNLALENGYVILSYKNKMWKSNKQYHDGKWHYLTVTSRAGRIDLLIDDEDKGQEQSGSTTTVDTSVGEDVMLLGKDTFKGCISNLYTRRQGSLFKAEDLSTFEASGDILLDVCTADSPVQLMLDSISKKDDVTPTINESVSACSLPVLVKHSYRLGGPVSSLSYSLPLQVLQPKPHFSLDVKTRTPEGLLFFAATRGGRSHLALYMSKGRIRFSVGKQREIFNREKYNDGKWHSVIFSLEKRKFRLVVDGIRAQDGQLTNAEFASMQQFMSPVYLGSAPESLHKELKTKILPKQSMSGCVRNFKMNGAPMSNPTTNQGAGPCFDGPTQPGAYFSGNGAHVIINDSFVVGSSFELLFNIRPRTQTGLLLHVGGSSRTPYGPVMGHYLSIYMLRGKVVAHVNNGKEEFTVSVQPKSTLCDGMFHKISVIKRKNVVQLYVDTMDNYKIGPPSFSTTMTKDPLYVGGIPEMSMQQTLPVMSSFVGCIQDMKINSDSVSFNRLSGVFGPVNLKECPG